MKALDDNRIVDLYLSRDEAAISQTSEKYGSRLRNVAYGIVEDLHTAEECENDTYMEAWNSIPPHEPKSYLFAFLARITRHIALDFCKERSRLKRSAFISELSAEMEQCILPRMIPSAASTPWCCAKPSILFLPHSAMKSEIFSCVDTGTWIPSLPSPSATGCPKVR